MTAQGTDRRREEPSAFLQETPHLDFGNPPFSDVLIEVTTEGMSLAKKLEGLFYFTRDSIPFSTDASLTASEALKKRKALCYTKAMIYVSFCRRLGVPAQVAAMRFFIKADLPDAHYDYHGVAKVFYDGKWLYLDTVTNCDVWYGWWARNKRAPFESPRFALDKNVVVDARYVTGLAFEDLGTSDVPQKWLDELRELGDVHNRHAELCRLGMQAQAQGDYAEARHLYEEALEIAKRLGDCASAAAGLTRMALLEEAEGNVARALELVRRAEEISTESRSSHAVQVRRERERLEGRA